MERLIKLKNCDPTTLEDALYLAAVNVEDAFLTCGGRPGRDYGLHDLMRNAVPLAAEMIRTGAVKTWRIPTADDPV